MMAPMSKCLLTGLVLWMASALLATLALFVLAFSAGTTVAGGERAALQAAVFNGLLGVTAVVVFHRMNVALDGIRRVLLSAGFALGECLLLGMLFLFTLVLLNR